MYSNVLLASGRNTAGQAKAGDPAGGFPDIPERIRYPIKNEKNTNLRSGNFLPSVHDAFDDFIRVFLKDFFPVLCPVTAAGLGSATIRNHNNSRNFSTVRSASLMMILSVPRAISG
jgi:hypothetical protein